MKSNAPAAPTVTAGGLIFCGLMVLVLFAGYAAPQLAPETAFGRWMAGLGMGLWTGIMVGISMIGERLLKMAGIPILALPKHADGQPAPAPEAPPPAAASDTAAEDLRAPVQVTRATLLLLASFALGILEFIPGINPNPAVPAAGFVATAVAYVIVSALYLWLVAMLYRGKNWARWVMLAFLVLGWVLGAGEIANKFARSPIGGTIDLAGNAVEIVACFYLFFGAGARWYAARSANPAKPT